MPIRSRLLLLTSLISSLMCCGKPITLKLKRTPKAKPRFANPRMNQVIHDYLTNGHLLPEDMANETLNRIAWQMHQNGYTDDEIIVSAQNEACDPKAVRPSTP